MSRGSADLFRYWATALIVTQAASCTTVSTGAGPNVQAEWEVEEPLLESRPATLKAVPVAAPIATKGLWVVRTTLSHPDSIRAMVRRAAGAGFNTLLVQVRGRGDAYYLGGIDPPADAIQARTDFDPLELTIQEAHARGIQVHAWMNVHLVSSAVVLSQDRRHLVHERPDLLAVPEVLARDLFSVDPGDPAYLARLREHARENRDRIEGLYTNPAAPEVKERVHAVAMDLVDRFAIDGIHLDYLRYPSSDFDYSRRSLERFRLWVQQRVPPGRWAELALEADADPLAFVQGFPGLWAEFRRAQITDMVERIYTGVKQRRPEVVVSVAVFPDARESFTYRYQDWEGWLRAGFVDVVAPMAYNPDDERFDEAISRAAAVAGPDRIWAGVGTHLTSYAGTVSKLGIAGQVGVRGFVLFSYDWAVAFGEGMDGVPFLQRVGRTFRDPPR